MPIRGAKPAQFRPIGLSDSTDASSTFFGACVSLQNLIFAQSDPEQVEPRPGALLLTSFPGFSSPGVVSLTKATGLRTYGTIATARNSGKDEPYSYNIGSNSFDTISGVTSGNSPTTPATSGPWNPPNLAVIGTKIIVTHSGFSNQVGVLDISTVGSPAWSAAGPTGAIGSFATTPVDVANFNNRAWYAVGNNLLYSDVLNPLNFTNANQALTIGDNSPIIGLSALPVLAVGTGVVPMLLIFKQNSIWFCTGDAATSNLLTNFISLTQGCAGQRTISPTPLGTIFMSNDSVYLVDQLGNLRPLAPRPEGGDLGIVNSDIQAPFINALAPTRAAASYNSSVYRICLDTSFQSQTYTPGDFFYDYHRARWNGVHTFPYHTITQFGNYFVSAANSLPGKLFKVQAEADGTSIYQDNGASYSCMMQSSLLPKKGDMYEKQIVESTFELGSVGGTVSYTCAFVDDSGAQLDNVTINAHGSGPLWGSVIWGAFNWAAASNLDQVYRAPWKIPLVCQRWGYSVLFTAQQGAAIGPIFSRYQATGYTVMAPTS